MAERELVGAECPSVRCPVCGRITMVVGIVDGGGNLSYRDAALGAHVQPGQVELTDGVGSHLFRGMLVTLQCPMSGASIRRVW